MQYFFFEICQKYDTAVLPAKSDSDVVFCLQNYQVLIKKIESMDRINTQVIYRFALAQVHSTS